MEPRAQKTSAWRLTRSGTPALRERRQHSGRWRNATRLAGQAAIWLAVGLAAGCVSLDSWFPGREGPPTGPVCQVVTTWQHEVVFTPDPAHGGASTPGLAGRLYLFGPKIDFPLAGDGSLVVDLYDDSHGVASPLQPPLEEWRIDKDTLHRLLRRDAIGWGYTLFLPWGTYKPEISRVHLKVCYVPLHGVPLYANVSPMTLTSDASREATLAGHHAAPHANQPAKN